MAACCPQPDYDDYYKAARAKFLKRHGQKVPAALKPKRAPQEVSPENAPPPLPAETSVPHRRKAADAVAPQEPAADSPREVAASPLAAAPPQAQAPARSLPPKYDEPHWSDEIDEIDETGDEIDDGEDETAAYYEEKRRQREAKEADRRQHRNKLARQSRLAREVRARLAASKAPAPTEAPEEPSVSSDDVVWDRLPPDLQDAEINALHDMLIKGGFVQALTVNATATETHMYYQRREANEYLIMVFRGRERPFLTKLKRRDE